MELSPAWTESQRIAVMAIIARQILAIPPNPFLGNPNPYQGLAEWIDIVASNPSELLALKHDTIQEVMRGKLIP